MELAAHVRHYQITAVTEVTLVSRDIPLKLPDDKLQGSVRSQGLLKISYLKGPWIRSLGRLVGRHDDL